MVDAADHGNLELATNELFALLDKPTMAGIPVLVLGNKSDLPAALDAKQLIEKMCVLNLYLIRFPVTYFMHSLMLQITFLSFVMKLASFDLLLNCHFFILSV